MAARVLVVDDSPTMRALLKHALSAHSDIEVVGEASHTQEAREKIKLLDPDVVTLDVEMPGMNGLAFLDKIMRLRPTPVIMVSNHTAPGASATIEALEIGAFECIAKPSGVHGNTFEALPELIREAAASRPQIAASRDASAVMRSAPAATHDRHANWPDLIGIGSSTGGVEALISLLADFPADCPPTLIVQHLPASFTTSFAARLDRVCRAHVAEAQHGGAILPGHVYLAPGGRHLSIKTTGGLRCHLTEDGLVQGHRPSVDVLFSSIAQSFEGQATGIILTGMGRDGAEGLLQMRKQGARTMAQDEATSLVYGMPRVAWEIGAAQVRLPLGKIAKETFA
ncbi:protein-glutamate methylesterase/protein-glutamine glutaminase [Mangrovibrevibacter kandeliae]|uniref:protein-glutamate methylesterase/protein-glutamine glutaminase n=1 Tax=Mangrovibrevibacter kandeliae TaxID=2968473 RepID=UPI0021193392|nr:chemotaxis response regulator protein-glutamate methylesterase [Aurantimonas sp. CSK15Z-1]MCQ8783922.1 chemotaxis response regulator protein-glutamate methylesterase [Aurantimonas sp. CSK15Z-1]